MHIGMYMYNVHLYISMCVPLSGFWWVQWTRRQQLWISPSSITASTTTSLRVSLLWAEPAPFSACCLCLIPELVWKVARYTSAAPIYFTECDSYVDGGLVANNPCNYALTKIQVTLILTLVLSRQHVHGQPVHLYVNAVSPACTHILYSGSVSQGMCISQNPLWQ